MHTLATWYFLMHHSPRVALSWLIAPPALRSLIAEAAQDEIARRVIASWPDVYEELKAKQEKVIK